MKYIDHLLIDKKNEIHTKGLITILDGNNKCYIE